MVMRLFLQARERCGKTLRFLGWSLEYTLMVSSNMLLGIFIVYFMVFVAYMIVKLYKGYSIHKCYIINN